MKKVLLNTLLCVAVLAGCGGKTSDIQDEPVPAGDTTTEENVKEPENSGQTAAEEVTKDNFRGFPVSQESDFRGSVTDDGYVIEGCTSEDKVIVIPSEILGTKVVGIGAYALSNLNCEAIVFPDSVEWIGEQAFTNNQKMKYIYLGTSLKKIGEMAFNSCLSLTEVEFPEGMEEINFCFIDDIELERVYIPSSVNNIIVGLSSGCSKLTVYTPAGSAAEEAAKSEGLNVVNE